VGGGGGGCSSSDSYLFGINTDAGADVIALGGLGASGSIVPFTGAE
jgi:hypothetical protein